MVYILLYICNIYDTTESDLFITIISIGQYIFQWTWILQEVVNWQFSNHTGFKSFQRTRQTNSIYERLSCTWSPYSYRSIHGHVWLCDRSIEDKEVCLESVFSQLFCSILLDDESVTENRHRTPLSPPQQTQFFLGPPTRAGEFSESEHGHAIKCWHLTDNRWYTQWKYFKMQQ